MALCVTRAFAQTISTFAGGGSIEGRAATATSIVPAGMTVAPDGTLIIADAFNNRVVRIANGNISTVAGNGALGGLGDGGRATDAELSAPTAVTYDSLGKLYIAERDGNRIRVISNGVISTCAGRGTRGYSGDGGKAAEAQFNAPAGLAFIDGVLYVADSGNNRVRRIDAAGNVTTIAGSGNASYSGDGGLATAASLNTPQSLAFDGNGGLLVADSGNNRVRRVDLKSGLIDLLAGNGAASFSGDDRPASEASLHLAGSGAIGLIAGVAADKAGNVFVADTFNSRVRRIDAATRTITTIAGDGTFCCTAKGALPTSTSFGWPTGLAIDPSGTVIVGVRADALVLAVRGTVDVVGGNQSIDDIGDGMPATETTLSQPAGLLFDRAGNLLISDKFNYRVRRVSAASHKMEPVAGAGGPAAYAGDGGPALQAKLFQPDGLAIDAQGNLYIADANNNRVRRVATNGIISTIAGEGSSGEFGDNGPAASAALNTASVGAAGLAIDPNGDLVISDSGNNRVRKVSLASGIITTIAGNGVAGYTGDNVPATSASLNHPIGLAYDSEGNLFIADRDNHRIRKVTPAGTISTVAGTGVAGFSGDAGPATSAMLNRPSDVRIATNGDLYIADTLNSRIRRVTAGVIATIAGSSLVGNYAGDGARATAAGLDLPTSIAIDQAGNVYIADSASKRVRVVTSTCVPVAAPALLEPANGASVSAAPALTWSAVSGALSYDLYVDTVSPPAKIVATIPSKGATTYSSTAPVTADGVYYWMVAGNGDATCVASRTPSPVQSFTIRSTANGIGPAGGTVTTTDGDQIQVPAGALTSSAPVSITPVAQAKVEQDADFAFADFDLSFIKAFDIHIGSTLVKPASLSIVDAVGGHSGSLMLLRWSRDVDGDGDPGFIFTDMAAVSGNRLIAAGSSDYPGLTQDGTYVVVESATPIGFVDGRIIDRSGNPLPGAAITSFMLPIVYASATSDGSYTLPVLVSASGRQRAVRSESPSPPFWVVTLGAHATKTGYGVVIAPMPGPGKHVRGPDSTPDQSATVLAEIGCSTETVERINKLSESVLGKVIEFLKDVEYEPVKFDEPSSVVLDCTQPDARLEANLERQEEVAKKTISDRLKNYSFAAIKQIAPFFKLDLKLDLKSVDDLIAFIWSKTVPQFVTDATSISGDHKRLTIDLFASSDGGPAAVDATIVFIGVGAELTYEVQVNATPSTPTRCQLTLKRQVKIPFRDLESFVDAVKVRLIPVGPGSVRVTGLNRGCIPQIEFAATPPLIARGGISTLTWSVTNAIGNRVSISGLGDRPANGFENVSPQVTTDYVLTARGRDKTVSKTATVTVAAPPTASLSAFPGTIKPGQKSTLTWITTGATSIAIDDLPVQQVPDGFIDVMPAQTTTYTLTARGPGGVATATATIYVEDVPPPVIQFEANPQTVSPGQPALLSWTTTYATAVAITGLGSQPLNGSVTVVPETTSSYTLSATGPGGSSFATVQVTVASIGVPVISSFTADPQVISPGQSSTLRWSTTDTVSVAISGVGSGLPATGSATVFPNVTTTYTLIATGKDGSSTQASRTVTVGQTSSKPQILSFAANPPSINAGQSSRLSWTTANAASAYITGVGNVPVNGYVDVRPSTTTAYSLTISGFDGSIVRDTINVTVSGSSNQGTYTGSFSGTTTMTKGGSGTWGCHWRYTVSGSVTANVTGSGPYGGTFTSTGTGSGPLIQPSSVTCAPQTSQAFTVTGSISGNSGSITASGTDANGGSYTFSNGTFSNGTLTGTLTISCSCFESPIVTTVVLTKGGSVGQP